MSLSVNINRFLQWMQKVPFQNRGFSLLLLLMAAGLTWTISYANINVISHGYDTIDENHRYDNQHRHTAAVLVSKTAGAYSEMPYENLNTATFQNDVEKMSMKDRPTNEIHDNDIEIDDSDGTFFMNFTTDTNRAVESVEVMFHDLKYRQACTNVGRYSILCMLIRYPFPLPIQVNDTSIRYTKPVDERFEKLYHDNVYVMKRNDWFSCSNQDNDMIVREDHNIKLCMETRSGVIAEERKDLKERVVVMWTRRNKQGLTLFHDLNYDEALDRVYDFFGCDHEVIVVGASPTHNVTEASKSLFGSDCQSTNVLALPSWYPNYNCDRHPNTSQRLLSKDKKMNANVRKVQNKQLDFTDLEENHINFGKADYRLIGDKEGYRALSDKSVLKTLTPLHRKSGWLSLRNLSMIVEYPFAHVQNQQMILNESLYQRTKSFQEIIPKYFLEFLNKSASEVTLSTRGYKFQHMFAFDGIPQFWPTATSGYSGFRLFTSNDDITTNKGDLYNFLEANATDWQPDYGTTCRGPLPPTSSLREINLLSRQNFEKLDFDMAWYGRTWEFFNLYFFQSRKWYSVRKGEWILDCTHPQGNQGLNQVHAYFIQAMIDDYYDD